MTDFILAVWLNTQTARYMKNTDAVGEGVWHQYWGRYGCTVKGWVHTAANLVTSDDVETGFTQTHTAMSMQRRNDVTGNAVIPFSR